MLTKKAKYALKAMAYMASFTVDDLVSGKDISETQNIPKKFLDAILIELKNGGFVFSKKGLHGGYSLARNADAITIGDIIRIIDGPLAPIPCASKTRYRPCEDCVDEASCQVRRVMQEAQKALSNVFDQMTIEQMKASPRVIKKTLVFETSLKSKAQKSKTKSKRQSAEGFPWTK